MPATLTPFTVYAPGGACWMHPRLTWWATWLRARGYSGWLPRRKVRWCQAVWPEHTCPCGAYRILWKDEDYASEKE